MNVSQSKLLLILSYSSQKLFCDVVRVVWNNLTQNIFKESS